MGKESAGFRIKPLVISAIACIFTIGFAIVFESPLELATAVSVYMLLVLAVAWRAGFRSAVVLSVCATLCLDFFFTEPLHTLRVISVHDVIALVSFALVSLLVSHLSDQAHSRELQIQIQRDQQQALRELSERMLLLDWKQDVGPQICDDARKSCGLTSVSLWDHIEDSHASSGETAVASETLPASSMAGLNHDAASGQESVRLLHSGVRPIGCIQFCGENLDPLFMSSVAVLVATTLGRVHALNAEVVAQSEKMSERLRASVLDGLAHTIKTPLTTISISSAGLMQSSLLSARQRELVGLIEGQTNELVNITDTLLRTAKLDPAHVLSQKPMLLNDLVHSSLRQMDVQEDSDRIHAVLPEEKTFIDADPEVLRLAFVQVLENALKYSTPKSEIVLEACIGQSSAVITIHNHGSFIAPHERQLIFRRFYRSPSVEHAAPGTGLGLAVARSAIEAHGGRIWVESQRHTGTTFGIELPVKGGKRGNGVHTDR